MIAPTQRHRNRRFLARVGGAVIGFAAVSFVVYQMGYRVIETASLPMGIWRITSPTALRVGQIVNFCPPANAALLDARSRGYLDGGRCEGNLEPMFKPIVALAGDRVSVTDGGVVVNGYTVPKSAPMPADGAGRAMPRPPGTHVVPHDQAWVVSDFSPYSFDSRYFGPIALGPIFGVATPVFLWSSP